jgi:hypothetical protein
MLPIEIQVEVSDTTMLTEAALPVTQLPFQKIVLQLQLIS